MGLLNAQSLRNKIHTITDYRTEKNLDIIFFTESWLKSHDLYEIGQLENNGECLFLNSPRIGRTGGGVGCLFRSDTKVTKVNTDSTNTFEHMVVNVNSSGQHIKVITIYRPEPSSKNNYNMSDFFTEFSNFLAMHQNNNSQIIILGDFNFHINKPTNTNTAKFLDILEMFDLTQAVNDITHKNGNTLDLVITRKNLPVQNCIVDEFISDHAMVLFDVRRTKDSPQTKKIKFRKTKDIDITNFRNDVKTVILQNTNKVPLTNLPLDSLMNIYASITNVLNKHAPQIEKTITDRKPTPWCTADIKHSKKAKRTAEKIWRKSKNAQDYKRFRKKASDHNKLLADFKTKDLTSKIQSNKGNSKALFRIINSSLNRKPKTPLPGNATDETLVNDFANYFKDKIDKIRADLDNNIINIQTEHHLFSGSTTLNEFSLLTAQDILKLIKDMPTKHCELDPLPTWLLKECINEVLPLITEIVNKSLQSGQMPKQLKHALIRPHLKKQNADLIMKNYRPVSNLAFLGKLIESAVITQFTQHLNSNNLHDKKQSAYKKAHSTETLLTKIHNDIMLNLDQGRLVMLILLDLSAAFDTIDHDILIERLDLTYGIKGNALNWFRSYLKNRMSAVCINQSQSRKTEISYGVPQGSKLGPILFNSYIAPISNIAEQHGIADQKYADDEQLMISFKPNPSISQTEAVKKMENCISDIKQFLLQNKLCCNSEKTELLIIGSKEQLKKLQFDSINVDNVGVQPEQDVRNLGIIFDKRMTMEKHINKMCRSMYYNIRNISMIRKSLSKEDSKLLVNALVTPHLDYGNALLFLIPKKFLNKLQVAQNSAVRLIEKKSRSDHITLHRKNLHWLPVQARIEYKILVTTWKSLNGLAPTYLTDLLKRSDTNYQLRNHDCTTLDVPHVSSNFGDRSFSRSGPSLWNKLPAAIKRLPTIESFKRNLKTHLFKLYYP